MGNRQIKTCAGNVSRGTEPQRSGLRCDSVMGVPPYTGWAGKACFPEEATSVRDMWESGGHGVQPWGGQTAAMSEAQRKTWKVGPPGWGPDQATSA